MRRISWFVSFLLAFVLGSAAMAAVVDFGWAAAHFDLGSIQLRTERGWHEIANGHPVVRRSPFRMFRVVYTDGGGVYDTNLSADPKVLAELDRLAVQ